VGATRSHPGTARARPQPWVCMHERACGCCLLDSVGVAALVGGCCGLCENAARTRLLVKFLMHMHMRTHMGTWICTCTRVASALDGRPRWKDVHGVHHVVACMPALADVQLHVHGHVHRPMCVVELNSITCTCACTCVCPNICPPLWQVPTGCVVTKAGAATSKSSYAHAAKQAAPTRSLMHTHP